MESNGCSELEDAHLKGDGAHSLWPGLAGRPGVLKGVRSC